MQKFTSIFLLAAALAGTGCANQTAESQLQRKKTVRVCQNNVCVEQSAQVKTFEPDPADEAADLRLHELVRLAEEGSHPTAAHDLGLRLLKGDGVSRNSYQGIQWLRKAGDQGDASAQLLLGKMYLSGYEEMGPDFVEAQTWLTRSAAQGNKEAASLLSEAKSGRQAERDNYQKRKDRREFQEWNYHTIPYYWHWKQQRWQLY
ncbi:MAG: sel1 repeat family protein [Gammaproteobacteria bacterium]|jgi:hypothetical protein|nr:sel1 repeat family protein [Gammaproteobacteria bacterium]